MATFFSLPTLVFLWLTDATGTYFCATESVDAFAVKQEDLFTMEGDTSFSDDVVTLNKVKFKTYMSRLSLKSLLAAKEHKQTIRNRKLITREPGPDDDELPSITSDPDREISFSTAGKIVILGTPKLCWADEVKYGLFGHFRGLRVKKRKFI